MAYAPNDSPTSALRSMRDMVAAQCTKQKGAALLRRPPASPVWLPQQFTAPCRNQTGDSSHDKAMAVPRENARKYRGFMVTACNFDHEDVIETTKASGGAKGRRQSVRRKRPG